MQGGQYPLYREAFEHESCGVGAVVDLNGRSTHRTVDQALCIVERLAHRAGSDALGTTGDGVGILTQLPHSLFSAWPGKKASPWVPPESTAWGCSFFRRMKSARRTPAASLSSWQPRSGSRYWAGGTFPAIPRSWVRARGAPCRGSASAFCAVRKERRPGRISTGGCISCGGSMKSRIRTPMSVPCLAAPLCIRA